MRRLHRPVSQRMHRHLVSADLLIARPEIARRHLRRDADLLIDHLEIVHHRRLPGSDRRRAMTRWGI